MTRNITLSAEDFIIRKAKEQAAKEHTSLNNLFRVWLKRYVQKNNDVASEYRQFMKQTSYSQSGRRFTRDEMNER